MICKNCKKITSANHSGLCFGCRHFENLKIRGITDCDCYICKPVKKEKNNDS